MLDQESYKSYLAEKEYLQKYLKYKNKYLELKNMIGGKEFTVKKLNKIWERRKKAGKVHPVTYENFTQYFSEYCWVSKNSSSDKAPSSEKAQKKANKAIKKANKTIKKANRTKEEETKAKEESKYGKGFFLYKIIKGVKDLPQGFDKVSGTEYAMFKINKDNLGEVSALGGKTLPDNFFNDAYLTTMILNDSPEDGTVKIDTDIPFDWYHEDHDGGFWVYKTEPMMTYKFK